jgi:hypothetical protein
MRTTCCALPPLLLFLALTGCAGGPMTVETVPIADVLNALKQEIQNVRPVTETMPGADASGTPLAACSDPDHVVRVIAAPNKAIVDLKTVVTTAYNASGSANIPAGPSGVIVSPSIGGSHSNVNTTDLTLTLGVQHDPMTRADLRTQIATLRKDLTDRAATVKDLSSRSDAPSRQAVHDIQNQIKIVQAKLRADEVQLAALDEMAPSPVPAPPPVGAPVSPPPQPVLPAPQQGVLDQNLRISEAFNLVVQGILLTNHQKPCFLPQALDVKVNFEVVKKVQGGVSVSFLRSEDWGRCFEANRRYALSDCDV